MRWSAQAVAAATGGELHAGEAVAATGGELHGGEAVDAGSERELSGVSIDTRTLRPGELFVAIRAARDGHEFIGAALAAGAGGLLVDRDFGRGAWGRSGRGVHGEVVVEVPVIGVADTAKALLKLGSAARDRIAGEVVGVTGSVGKTSTKDLAAAAVGAALRVAASERSFNNDLGVPLTLANAAERTQVAVVELGSRGRGHLTRLCEIARPSVGVVTAVAPAHTETFGSLDQVAVAKAELIEALPSSGIAVLNFDDDRVRAMSALTPARVLAYSAAGAAGADVIASSIKLDDELRPSFEVRSPWGRATVRLEARGAHQVSNALAALAVAGSCGVDLVDAAAALVGARLSPWRMELHRAASGAVVINDAYNANPASVRAALEALAAVNASWRVAVLGEMAELGECSAAEHLAVADLAHERGIEVIAVGTDAYGVEPVQDVDEALRALGPLRRGDAVLIKASRVAGLERLGEALLEAAQS
jgi:UDP-N-acetylmuramoyl-tripeptide--D-alanyl-D-alanine ligase